MLVIYDSFISTGSCLIYISNLFLMGIKIIFRIACFFSLWLSAFLGSGPGCSMLEFVGEHCGETEAKPPDLVSWKESCTLYFYHLYFYVNFQVLWHTSLHFGNTESPFSDSGFKVSLFENSLYTLLWFPSPPLLVYLWTEKRYLGKIFKN